MTDSTSEKKSVFCSFIYTMIKSKDKKIHVPYTHLYVYTQLGVCMCSDAISEQRQELGMEHIYGGMDPSRRQHV